MKPARLVEEFQRILSEEESPLALAALRWDELVWKALQNNDAYIKLAGFASGSLYLWNPASLAVLMLEDQGFLVFAVQVPLTAVHLPHQVHLGLH